MGRSFLLFFIIFFSSVSLCLAQRQGPNLLYIWGMQYVGDSIQVDDTEITISEWLEYVFDGGVVIHQERIPVDNHFFQKYILDSGKKKMVKVLGLTKENLIPVNWDKEYKHYLETPITGISYQQAVEFCKWRTAKDSVFAYSSRMKEKFIFELLSPELFDMLNITIDSLNQKGGAVFNYRNATYFILRKKGRILVDICGKNSLPVASFISDKLSLYDMAGNVAEMTSQYGIAKGGSFAHYASEALSGKENHYSKPENWLGFRCVARKVRIYY